MNSKVIEKLKHQTQEACRIKGVPFENKYLDRVKKIYLATPRIERHNFTLFESKRKCDTI